jgi:hypothetical protein
MKKRRVFVCAVVWSALWTAGFVPPARAQQPGKLGEGELVTKEFGGIFFKLPADWPIEVRDGVISPIPVEDYLARKFAVVNTQMKVLEERLQELEKRNQALEKVLQSLRKTFQELAPPTEGNAKEQ